MRGLRAIILVLMLTGVCLSISCSFLNSATDEDEPIIRVTHLRLSDISDTQATIKAEIEIENPNPTQATLTKMIYEIHLGHHDDEWIFIDQEEEDRSTIEPEQAVRFAVAESVENRLKLDSMKEMIFDTDSSQIRITGKVWIEIGVNLFEIPFEERADIPEDIRRAGVPE